MKTKLSNVRLSFPDLFTARTVNGEGDPRFGATFLIAKDDPQALALEKTIEQVATEKWGAKAGAILKQLRATDKVCLRDGAAKDYAGFDGCMYVSANSKERPLVIDANKAPLLPQDGRPYAGCYVNASIDVWAMDNQYGKRIAASLKGVQFARHGDAFAGGGGTASPDEFEDVSAGATADDLV